MKYLITTIAAVVLIGCKSTSTHQAVFVGNIGAIKQHLNAGLDVEAKDDKFVGTFLHWASAGGQKEIVELLIAKGADVNAKNERDETPLDCGIKNKRSKISDLLHKHGGKTGEELKAAGN